MNIRTAVHKDMDWMRSELQDSGNLLKSYSILPGTKEVDLKVKTIFEKMENVFIAESNSQQLGLVQLNQSPFKKSAHTGNVFAFVDKEHRSEGIGTKLLEHLINEARRKNLKMLYLEVYETNRAVNLYKRLGFTQCGYNPRYKKEGLSFMGKIFMQMEL